MLHITDTKNKAVDAMSHHPSSEPDLKDNPLLADDITSLTETTTTDNHHFISGIFSVEAVEIWTSFQAVTCDMVREATSSDQHMCDLLEHIQDSSPDPTYDLPSVIRPFHQYH